MRPFIYDFVLRGLLACATLIFCLAIAPFPANTPFSQSPSSFDPSAVPVYIGELELHAAIKPADRLPDPKPKADLAGSALAKPLYTEDETPAKLAHAIVNTLQSNLLQALAKIGYKAQPAPVGVRPSRGIELRGVFAEPDELNRIRRAILGAGSQSPKLLLYIGIANLSKPEQPFYQQVIPNSTVPNANDGRYGPVISISTYVPVDKFELDRNPSPEDLEKAAQAIAAQIDALIRNNAAALAAQ